MIDKIPFILLIVGKPGQGKSHLIKYLCYDVIKKKKTDNIFLFGGSTFTGAYDYLPKPYIGKYTENNLKKIVNWQLSRIKNNKAKDIMIIFDDVMNLTNEFKRDLFRKLISEYRHYRIAFIFSVQYLKGVNPVFRECTTHAVFFKTSNKLSLDAIHENFMNDLSNSKEVGNYLKTKLDEKHKFLFVDIHADDNDKYTVGKCDSHLPTYKLNFD
jgi:nucleoside-triphosphatase THEP1